MTAAFVVKIYTKDQVKTLTKSQLEQLRGLPADIRQRERQILRIEKELEKVPNTMDSVQGSMPDHPYTAHAITIRGRDEQKDLALRARLRRQRVLLIQRQQMLLALQIDAMEFVEAIPETLARVAIRGYYIERKAWNDIADEVNCETVTADSLRMLASRYLQKNNV